MFLSNCVDKRLVWRQLLIVFDVSEDVIKLLPRFFMACTWCIQLWIEATH